MLRQKVVGLVLLSLVLFPIGALSQEQFTEWDTSNFREAPLSVAERINRDYDKSKGRRQADFAIFNPLNSAVARPATLPLTGEESEEAAAHVRGIVKAGFLPASLGPHAKKPNTGNIVRISFRRSDDRSPQGKRFLILQWRSDCDHSEDAVPQPLKLYIYIDMLTPIHSYEELYQQASEYLKLPPMNAATPLEQYGDPVSPKLFQVVAPLWGESLSDEEAAMQFAEYPETWELQFKTEGIAIRGGRITIEENGNKQNVNAIMAAYRLYR